MLFKVVLQSTVLFLIFTTANTVDHSRGVYMHDHPDFPSVIGGPGGPYRTHYLHSRFGIGHKHRRAVKSKNEMLRMFYNRPQQRDEQH
ncbi:uncharacterized protein LOC110065562 [Orbicella faveolata]|uniref:uncharacterized protein LOC110065562 n=1 Tax=Orbicella faveolata TaxID=48498 RepID=UPI0009E1A2D9|nr:uncharacterized protein LOC110065562 [Orbicella faveolata]